MKALGGGEEAVAEWEGQRGRGGGKNGETKGAGRSTLVAPGGGEGAVGGRRGNSMPTR